MSEVETVQECTAARELLQTSDLNWLLHRAAQRFGEAMEAAALREGAGMRSHLVLTALIQEPGRTQLSLAAGLGLDKTTLTTVLDKLEQLDLVVRRPDPADRRVRIPEITEQGRAVQHRVAPTLRAIECELMRILDPRQQEELRACLTALVAAPMEGTTRPAGSCL